MNFLLGIIPAFLLFHLPVTFAQGRGNEFSIVTVHDVSKEYRNLNVASVFPTPTPKGTPSTNPIPPLPGNTNPGGIVPVGGGPTPSDPSIPPLPNPFPAPSTGNINIDSIITIGSKVWDFVINNKPTADYKALKGSVVPSGITDWSQLTGWSKDKFSVKIYRVEFKSITGKVGGSFDYRVSFFYGGNYKGKGKFIGQISVIPGNIKLHTDRSLTFRAELLDALNFGTEEDPISGVQLQISWSSPTTTRYEMHSAEYFMYATGEIQDITNGN